MNTTALATGAAIWVAVALAASTLLAPLRHLPAWRRSLVGIWLTAFSLFLVTQAPALGVVADGLAVKLFRSGLVLAMSFTALQLVDLLWWEWSVNRHHGRPVPRLLITVTHFLVLVGVLLWALDSILGLNVTPLLATSTVVSAILGLALQDMLKNIIAGLALQVESPFSLGDWVEVAGHEGVVSQLNLRSLTLRTRTQNDVVLPNGEIATAKIVNFSRPDSLQGIDALIDVAESHRPGVVKAVLQGAALEAAGVCAEPAPRAYLQAFGDSSITYRIRFWVTDYAHLSDIQDAVLTNCWYRLRRYELDLPTLTRVVLLHQVPEDQDERRRRAEELAIADELGRLPLLASLDADQRDQVASQARTHLYTAGEILVRQADPGDSLFVITRGRVAVQVQGSDGLTVTVAHRSAGDAFGEMSLLTGAPRNATIVAETETEVVVVNQAAVREVLLAEPRIVEDLTDILLTRAAETEAQLKAAAEAAMIDAEKDNRSLRQALLDHIRGVFGLGVPAPPAATVAEPVSEAPGAKAENAKSPSSGSA